MESIYFLYIINSNVHYGMYHNVAKHRTAPNSATVMERETPIDPLFEPDLEPEPEELEPEPEPLDPEPTPGLVVLPEDVPLFELLVISGRPSTAILFQEALVPDCDPSGLKGRK